MKYFVNTVDQQVFAFEDDVEVLVREGVYTFNTTDGSPLESLPTTLLPCDPPPPYVPPPMDAAAAIAERNALLAVATLRIDPLNDAVELGDATPAEVASLRAWRQYRVALNRIEQQPGFPATVEWPIAPA
ncbi:tail fiber assembly protein [Variovorax gossypii]